MMPPQQWARNLSIEQADIDYLTNLLLERETPLTTDALARAFVESRIQKEADTLKQRFQNVSVYDPAKAYDVGDRLLFTEFDFETGVVVAKRPGKNGEYGEFSVVAVQFDRKEMNTSRRPREFAAEFPFEHDLNLHGDEDSVINGDGDITVDEVLTAAGTDITTRLEARLRANPDLIYMAKQWFPRDLLMEANVGHLNLAEAVLDISGGGPMRTEDILEQIGGLGKAPMALQVFSMNYALNKDERFDEVGPTGEVLWHLSRLEPEEVQRTPTMLRFSQIEYDRSLLTPEMLAMEAEIGDELSPDLPIVDTTQATITLSYPHRRLGTLPLNARTAAVFPTALQTPRVSFTLLDGQDQEEYPAWVVRKERYVYGLAKFYRKHKLPVGAYVTIRRSEDGQHVVVDYRAHKARTEWIRLIVPKGDGITFENDKRAIGAEYDELMILGADELAAVDTAFQTAQQQKKTLVALLRQLIPPLCALTPQGAVHAKTLYSAINVLRRCPPGPLFAVLVANPDFQHVGGDFWKLSGD